MTKTYSLIQAAATLGISRNTLAGWLDKGCPAERRADRARGVEWELSIPSIFEWRTDTLVREAVARYNSEDGHVTKDEADRRRAVAMAITAEVEADTMLRDVVARSDAEACMAEFCQVIRAGLDNASAKIAGRAVTMTDPNEIRELCQGELNRSFVTAREELDRLWSDTSEGRPSDPDVPDEP